MDEILEPQASSAHLKAPILSEAIAATGGPGSNALASVKIFVDRRHPDFPWSNQWSAEIAGAKAGLRQAAGANTSTRPVRATVRRTPAFEAAPTASKPSRVVGSDLELAKELIGAVGSLARARHALELCARAEAPACLANALDAWSALVEAVGGNQETAERALAVMNDWLLGTGYPKFAAGTSADAA